ncbi:glycoside hydrolase family 3 C-terminal domain-containing protein [Sphingomonas faeni]|uniref:glycoside hydrolase family 3 C-terminal domain-containing protein n=1 Tax=Sphingomonas faeni TaxID=185950 RepID=UPI0027D8DEC9|nr:glycoside hydrolase family 3 C-terminal domain-containing protein [Sphingomonas faeni]
MVLLKDTGVLPIRRGGRVLVTGDGADSVAKQSGGWTLTWQGTGTHPEHFPHAQSIFAGIREVARYGGGDAELSRTGEYAIKPDVAIVVFGEDPYAEFQGDRADLLFDDAHGALATMRRLKSEGVPVVAVFLSGRPLWVNRHLNAADAFVAGWLPGSEGGGIADVLYGRRMLTGRLSFSWPAQAGGAPLNSGDTGYAPLFPFGFGLKPGRHAWKVLSERSGVDESPPVAVGPLFADGRATGGRLLQIDGANDSPQTVTGSGNNGSVAVRPVDRERQEDAREIVWSGRSRGTLLVANLRPQDLGPQSPTVTLTLRVDRAPTAPTSLEMRCGQGCVGKRDVTAALTRLAGRGWTTFSMPLSCLIGADLHKATAPFAMTTSGEMRLSISSISLQPSQGEPCS